MPGTVKDITLGLDLDDDELKSDLRKATRTVDRFGKRIDRTGKRAQRSFDRATRGAQRFRRALTAVAGVFVFKQILDGIGNTVRGFGRLIRSAAEQQRWFRRLASTASAFNATLTDTQRFLSELTILTGFDRDQVRSGARDLQERIAEGASDPFSEVARAALLAGLDVESLVGSGGLKTLRDLRAANDAVVDFIRNTRDRGYAAYVARALTGDESERILQGQAALTARQVELNREYTDKNLQLPYQITPFDQAILNTAIENFDLGIKNLHSAVAQGFLPAIDRFNKIVSDKQFHDALDGLSVFVEEITQEILDQLDDPEVRVAIRNAFNSLKRLFNFIGRSIPEITNFLLDILVFVTGDAALRKQLKEQRREARLAEYRALVEASGRPFTKYDQIAAEALADTIQLGFTGYGFRRSDARDLQEQGLSNLLTLVEERDRRRARSLAHIARSQENFTNPHGLFAPWLEGPDGERLSPWNEDRAIVRLVKAGGEIGEVTLEFAATAEEVASKLEELQRSQAAIGDSLADVGTEQLAALIDRASVNAFLSVGSSIEGVPEEIEKVLDDLFFVPSGALPEDIRAAQLKRSRFESDLQTQLNRTGGSTSDLTIDEFRRDATQTLKKIFDTYSNLLAKGTDEQVQRARDFYEHVNSLQIRLSDGALFEPDLGSRTRREEQTNLLINDLILRGGKLANEGKKFASVLYDDVLNPLRNWIDQMDEQDRRLRSPFAQNFTQSILSAVTVTPEQQRKIRQEVLAISGIPLAGLTPAEIKDRVALFREHLIPLEEALTNEAFAINQRLFNNVGENFFNVLGAFEPPEKVTGAQLQELTEDILARLGIPSAEALRTASDEAQEEAGRLFAAGVRRYEERNLRTGESRTDEELANELEVARNRVTTEIASGVQAGLLAGLENGTQGFLEFFRENLLNALTDQLAKSIAQGILEGITKSGANKFGDFIVDALLGTSLRGGDDVNRLRPDRFHGGGVVPGRLGEEVPIIALAGETIRTRQQERQLRGDSGVTVNLFGTDYGAEFRRNLEQTARLVFAQQQAQTAVVDYGA